MLRVVLRGEQTFMRAFAKAAAQGGGATSGPKASQTANASGGKTADKSTQPPKAAAATASAGASQQPQNAQKSQTPSTPGSKSAVEKLQDILSSGIANKAKPDTPKPASSSSPSNLPNLFTSLKIEAYDPAKATEHVNRIYTIPDADTRQMFPEGFPGTRPRRPPTDEHGKLLFPQDEEARVPLPHTKLFCDRHIILRQCMIDLVKELDTLRENKEKLQRTRGWLLKGDRGSGKSFCLAHLINHCRTQGWLVVNIPQARLWMNDSPQWFRSPQRGYYDQPDLAMTLLSNIRRAESAKLAQVPLRTTGAIRLLANLHKNDANLLDLVEFGLTDSEVSVEAALALREELNEVVEFPVLLAIDEYNHLFDQTDYFDQFGRLFPEQMRMIAKWRSWDGEKLRNGIMIGATNHSTGVVNEMPEKMISRSEYRHIPNMNVNELQSLLVVLQHTGLMLSPITPQVLQMIYTLSAGRPGEAARVVTKELLSM
eukprot:c9931_g1_i1.p1 GENE.c9931_g1_i1~~c9931_g1_i1.p1  ORF type:complete len:484 (+),score=118.05 c9931_g1_i1:45-1496(+)